VFWVSGTLWLSAGFGKFYSVSVKVYRQEGVCPSWFPERLLLRPRSTPNFIMKLGTPLGFLLSEKKARGAQSEASPARMGKECETPHWFLACVINFSHRPFLCSSWFDQCSFNICSSSIVQLDLFRCMLIKGWPTLLLARYHNQPINCTTFSHGPRNLLCVQPNETWKFSFSPYDAMLAQRLPPENQKMPWPINCALRDRFNFAFKARWALLQPYNALQFQYFSFPLFVLKL
jgi:hypothetical protein